MVDTHDSKSCDASHESSSLSSGTGNQVFIGVIKIQEVFMVKRSSVSPKGKLGKYGPVNASQVEIGYLKKGLVKRLAVLAENDHKRRQRQNP